MSSRVPQVLLQYKNTLAATAVALLAILSGVGPDSRTFAALRVVENMATRAGAVFNPGLPEQSSAAIESPLHFMILLSARLMELPLPSASVWIGLLFFFLGLLILGAITDSRDRPISAFAILLPAAIPAVLHYASNGSQFGLAVFLLTFLLYLNTAEKPEQNGISSGALSGFLFITIPGLLIPGLLPAIMVWTDKKSPVDRRVFFLRFLGGLALVVVPVELFFAFYYGSPYPAGGWFALQSFSYTEGLARFITWRMLLSPGAILALIGFSFLAYRLVRLPSSEQSDPSHTAFLYLAGLSPVIILLWMAGLFPEMDPLLPLLALVMVVVSAGNLAGRIFGHSPTYLQPLAGLVIFAVSLSAAPFPPHFAIRPPAVYPEGLDPETIAAGEEPVPVVHLWKNFARCVMIRPFPVTVGGKCGVDIGSSFPGEFAYNAKADLTILDGQQAGQGNGTRNDPHPDPRNSLREKKLAPVFCATGDMAFDRVMMTRAGVLHTLDPQWLALHPDRQGLVANLKYLKQSGNPTLLRLEQKEGLTLEDSLKEMAPADDPFYRNKQDCWKIFDQPAI